LITYKLFGTVYEEAYLTELPISRSLSYSPHINRAQQFWKNEESKVETSLLLHDEYTYEKIGTSESKPIKRKKGE